MINRDLEERGNPPSESEPERVPGDELSSLSFTGISDWHSRLSVTFQLKGLDEAVIPVEPANEDECTDSKRQSDDTYRSTPTISHHCHLHLRCMY